MGALGVVVFTPDALPAPLQAVLDTVRVVSTDQLAAATPGERAAWLVGLRQVIDTSEAALAVFDAHGDGDTLHAARSTAAWLKGAVHLAAGDASERVRLARPTHRELKVTIDLLDHGRVTYDQVRAIGRRCARCRIRRRKLRQRF